MILAVDCGNSAVKAALVDGPTVRRATRLEDAPVRASEAALLARLEELIGSEQEVPSALLVVSVVDRWTDRLERVAGALGLPLTVVAGSSVPVRTALVRADQTGVDRLLGAWAAWSLYGAPVVVVDLGTATTVDAVDADGFFLGGAILPGPAAALDALVAHAPRLPRIELEEPERAIGEDTASALRSGIVLGHVGAVRELVARMRPELEASVAPGEQSWGLRVVLTGGHAGSPWARRGLVEPAGPGLPPIVDHVDPDLLLKGLGLLAERERAGAIAT
jgi:type III pantothenate kinase